jgi:plastocyanin
MTTTLGTRRKRQAIALALALLGFGLALAGMRGAIASAGEPAAQASRSVTVDINHFAFHPPTLTVAKGTTVNFSNTSAVAHTATRGGSFDTGKIKPGTSVGVRFKQTGTFAYHCEIHPFMHGKIVVN